MGSRIVKVFYDNQCYPFKDSARTVRYPITGSSFTGSSNVNEIRFYVRDIGGVNTLTWVANVKLPNGKILYQLLTDIHLDSEINEYYLSFNLSQFYTQLKGDIYISLNGCIGQVEIETDEETGISTINGDIDTRTIVATGVVKFTINYAVQRPSGYSFDIDQYETIIQALSGKASQISTIQVVADISQEDLSNFNESQLFYDLNTKAYYQKSNGSAIPVDALGILANQKMLFRTSDDSVLFADLFLKNRLIVTNYDNTDYLTYLDHPTGGAMTWFAFDLKTRKFYVKTIQNPAETFGTFLVAATVIENVEQTDEHSKIYATDGNGAQILLPYATLPSSNSVVIRDEYANIRVPITPAGNNCATSKKYVDDKVKDALQKSFQKVDVEQYTSLEDFLDSRGEEGYVYLYPVKLSEAPTYESGYYQYIWENNQWQDLGTTQIDLSDYYTKGQTNTLLNGKVDKKTSGGLHAYTHNGSTQNETSVDNSASANSIPLRDNNGNIKVGTPTDNAHATPKTYVDTLGATKVDKTNSGEKVYGTDELGAQTTYNVDSDLVGSGAIVRRESGTGTVVVGTPTSNTHATTKSYVDTLVRNAISNVYKIKGSATVSQINAMTTQEEGDVYNVTDSGTIVLGNLQVFTGDNIVWTGSAWDKLGAEIDWQAYDEKFIAAGFFEVQNYNENTGEITLVYATELYDMSYDSDSGVLSIQAN